MAPIRTWAQIAYCRAVILGVLRLGQRPEQNILVCCTIIVRAGNRGMRRVGRNC